ncbi:MAG: efflux RND transporter periplasmic adaptor subunit [Candidatus Latescibacteria bacterium]|nr:efflux RND transporter periplasmic adaptor subunit [Candidatus Latescibacterota bacterium]
MNGLRLLIALVCATAWSQEDQEWTVALEPAHAVQVCALIAGQVVRVAVQEGALVNTGDTLLCLDDTDLCLAEAEYRIAYERSQRFLDRVQQLNQHALLSAQELEDAQYQAQAAQLRWQRAQLELQRTHILAPQRGLVAQCAVQVGELTTVRQVLLQIIDPIDLQAKLFLPLDQLSALRLHQPVTAQVPATGQHLKGRIERISPLSDPQSGRCAVQVRFPQAGPRLKPGTLIQVQLTNPQPLHGGKER